MISSTQLVVWAADVGSIARDRFGWCRADHSHSTSVTTGCNQTVHDFVSGIAADVSAGYSVALGFECPLFVPVTAEPKKLNNARPGEGNRPWSAGAGTGALATGLPICVWTFEQIKQLSTVSVKPTLDWNELLAGEANFFLWEAFVSAKAKAEDKSHHGDAEVAVRSFWSFFPHINEGNAIKVENPYSLVGAAVLRSGLSDDLSLLSQSCIVVKS